MDGDASVSGRRKGGEAEKKRRPTARDPLGEHRGDDCAVDAPFPVGFSSPSPPPSPVTPLRTRERFARRLSSSLLLSSLSSLFLLI